MKKQKKKTEYLIQARGLQKASLHKRLKKVKLNFKGRDRPGQEAPSKKYKAQSGNKHGTEGITPMRVLY